MPPSLQIQPHTHTGRSLACPLLTLSSARPFSNCIFRSDGAPVSLPPASSSLTHTRRMDGFCNQNTYQLGSLAGLSFPVVYVGVVECTPASFPYTQDGRFLQPERRPARLPRRTIFSICICRCCRIIVCLPLHILLLHTQVSR
jgi:hypothetical protein